jgi:hypothetical protein
MDSDPRSLNRLVTEKRPTIFSVRNPENASADVRAAIAHWLLFAHQA